eukprot:jgi/Ulvmu1/1874/UM012_0031.1
MLRVVFHSASDRHFHAVMRGLSVLCDRLRKHGDQQFTMYNVSKVAGPDEATGVDMVEIHNDTDNVFSSALDQVVSSIQRTSPSIDHDLLQQARSVKYRHGPAHYCMLRGKLFSAIPAALAFVVRQASPGSSKGGPPIVLRFTVTGGRVTGALDLMSQMADLALKEPGIVACLVQGMGAHADVASLLFLFASDMELFSFAQNQQARLLGSATKEVAGKLTVRVDGDASKFAQQAAAEYMAYVQQAVPG